MKKSLQEILTLSAWELAYWHAYYQRNPFGYFRTDIHAAQVCRAFVGGSIDDHMLTFNTQPDNPQAAYSYFLSTMKPEDRPTASI